MSFDPRSLERLRQLGRELPQPLDAPQQKTAPDSKSSPKRHRVETEDDPELLFHELMKVSNDGNIPDHLMARLKQAEQKKDEERRRKDRSSAQHGNESGGQDPSQAMEELTKGSRGENKKGKNTRPRQLTAPPGSEEESLYVTFGQLLLEDDEDES